MNENDWTQRNTAQRVDLYLTQTKQTHMQAAITLGVSVSSVSRWVRGKNIPDLRTRRAIIAVLEAKG